MCGDGRDDRSGGFVEEVGVGLSFFCLGCIQSREDAILIESSLLSNLYETILQSNNQYLLQSSSVRGSLIRGVQDGKCLMVGTVGLVARSSSNQWFVRRSAKGDYGSHGS